MWLVAGFVQVGKENHPCILVVNIKMVPIMQQTFHQSRDYRSTRTLSVETELFELFQTWKRGHVPVA